MKITSKGQITIPQHIRESLGLLPDTEVEFEIDGDGVLLRKATGVPTRGTRMVEQMRGKGTIRMSTDEIMSLMRGTEDEEADA